MDEKTIDKRLNKMMCKTRLKGVFKKVDTLEECDIVLIMFDDKPYRDIFTTKKEFKEKILPQYNEINTDNLVLRYLKYTNSRRTSNKLPNRLIDRTFYR